MHRRTARHLSSTLALTVLATLAVLALSVRPALAAVTTQHLRAVTFTGTTGYAAGANGTILKSTDSGANWNVVNGTPTGFDLQGVAADGSSVWAVDRTGALIKSLNAGGLFQVRYQDIGEFNLNDASLFAVDGVANSSLITAGTSSESPATAWFSTDGGESFNLNDVFKAGVYPRPEDPDAFPKLGLGEFYGIDIISETKGWAVGYDHFLVNPDPKPPALANDGIIWRFDPYALSTPWGAWAQQAAFASAGPLYDVSFGSTLWGVAVGADGHAYYTVNGGATWTQGTTGTQANLRGVAAAAGNVALAVGDGGRILRTTDGGANWTTLSSPTGASLRGISALSATAATAVGDSGTIVRTINGTSWQLVDGAAAPPSVTSLTSATHSNADTIYNTRSVTLSWTAQNATGYSYTIDRNATTDPDNTVDSTAKSASLTLADDGVWYFHIKATNGSTWSGTTTHRAVRADATRPTLSHTAKETYIGTATFRLTAEDDGSSGVREIRYSLDGGDEVSVNDSSVLLSTSNVGPHTVTAHSYDNVGNVSDLLEIAFTVEPLPTAPAITSLSSSTHPVTTTWYSSRAVTMSWTAQNATGYSYSFDQTADTVPDDTLRPAGTSVSQTLDGDGLWYFHIKATNGSTWSGTSHRAVRVDATKPTISHNASAAYTGNASFTLSAADTGGSAVKEIRYALDGGAEAIVNGASAPVSTSALGPHEVVARSYDNAGNISDQVTVNFTVNPGPTITGMSSSTHPNTTTWYSSRAVTMSWTAQNATGYSYSFDQSPSTDPGNTVDTTQASISQTLASDGVWYFHIKATNGSAWSGTVHREVRIETAKPTLSHNASATYTGSASFTLSAADTGGSGVKEIRYTLDGGTEAVVSGASAPVSTSAVGPHQVVARSYDNAGNVSEQLTVNFTVNPAPALPTVTSLTSPSHPNTSLWYGSRAVTMSWTAQNASGYSFVFDKAEATTPDATVDTAATSMSQTLPNDGVWYFHIKARNASGAWSAVSHYKLQIDTVPGAVAVPIAGNTRYETCVKVSQQAFPTPPPSRYVIIATGLNWPDALGGAALARAYDAPILLVTKDTVPAAIGNEIVRLKATKAIILGGTASVSTAVETGLRARGITTIGRLGGANRYETSRMVATRVKQVMGASFPNRAFVATGGNFADALAASPISAKLGWPIYLVGNTLTTADRNAMKAIGVTKVTILGGTGAVQPAVETGLNSAFGDANVDRKAGASRYATALQVATFGIGLNQGLGWDNLALAVGDNFPDALAGGVLQGRSGSVMLLTPGKTLDPGVRNTLVANKAKIHQIRFLGGLLSITQTVRTAALSALK